MAKLIIVCGLPGSGKTTLALKLKQGFGALRLCPDEWMTSLSLDLCDQKRRAEIELLQWQIAKKILTLGGIAIVEWGTWSRSERDALRTGAKALGAEAELHYLKVPADELLARIQKRGAENPPIQKWDVIRWFSKFEEPTPEELAQFDRSFVSS